MPRVPRQRSESGIYHIMIRGINRQHIFQDDEDKHRFLYILKAFAEKDCYDVYGYCLMNNHIHLLMEEVEDDISTGIQRISSSYVFWYNRKYERSGHLFQGRFKSESVEDDNYLRTVLRYIHHNPIKAGLCKRPRDYQWSSYNEYISKPKIIDRSPCLSSFSEDALMAIELFKDFNNQDSDENYLDFENFNKLTDDEVRERIKKMDIKNIDEISKYNRDMRNDVLRKLKDTKGITIRQLSRITGVSKSIIGRL